MRTIKKISFIFIIFLLLSICSCSGTNKRDKIIYNSIYQDGSITIRLNNCYTDAPEQYHNVWYRTKKKYGDIYDELYSNNVSFLDFAFEDYKFIQINNRGMYSLLCKQEENDYYRIKICEMSMYLDDGKYFPFPVYGLKEISGYLNRSNKFENQDYNYLVNSINKFNKYLSIYDDIILEDKKITLVYKDLELILNFDDNNLLTFIYINKSEDNLM